MPWLLGRPAKLTGMDFFRPVDGIPSTVYDHGIVKPKEPKMPVTKPIALPRTTVTAAATEHLRKEIVGGGLQPERRSLNRRLAKCWA